MSVSARLIDSRHDARGAIVVVTLVSILRLVLERAMLSGVTPAPPPIGLMMLVSNVVFYALCFWLFTALLSALLWRAHERVANLVLVGLAFGLLPPLLELFLPEGAPRPFIWYREVSWTFFADDQPRGEGVTLWLLVAATGVWVWLATRSLLRALFGIAGAYLMWPAITAVVLAFPATGLSTLGLLAIAFVIWLAFRWRALARCVLRLNHGLPHGALAVVGALWVGRSLETGLERAAVMVLGVFVLLVHNDHYDRVEDQAAGRAPSSTPDDVAWTTFFYVLLLLAVAPREPMLALAGGAFLAFGFVYHHPALRLKERFCLSYLVEGAWAALAFLAGAAHGSGLAPGPSLLVPATAIFGGGALISMPKDWKDVAADRAARIPTLYVLLTRRERSERSVHRVVVVAVTLGLLAPPLWLFTTTDAAVGACAALALVALSPGALLWALADRGRAVELSLFAIAGYLGLLAAAVAPLARPVPTDPPTTPTPEIVRPADPVAGDTSLTAVFAGFELETLTAPPIDYGRLHRGAPGTSYAVTPTTPGGLAQIVARAYSHNVPMRIRGRAHSMNGSTLPASDELTIRTSGLVRARFEKPGTVTVEAGVAIQDLRKALAPLGWDLPVYNGGTADGGPSIGGFINAGGFGIGSADNGGFWDNVDAVTLVVAEGQMRTLAGTDPDFGWLFGAMGQLGIVREARLDLVPRDRAAPEPPYPAGQVLTIAGQGASANATSAPPIYWYTLFVSPEEKDAAAAGLAAIEARHAGELTFRAPYTYAIRHRSVVAPLVYGRRGDFFAIGIWGDKPRAQSVVQAIDAEVAALAKRAGYRRYVQAEVLSGVEAYRDYFGAEIYEELERRRRVNDPKGLFNRGTVFRQ